MHIQEIKVSIKGSLRLVAQNHDVLMFNQNENV
jgi:hypothetical protein